MNGRIMSFVVCMLVMVSTIGSVTGFVLVGKTPQSLARENTLYVGGNGPNNYTKIQDAINASVNGDTVFVYDDSSPYYENIIIRKSITLLGEDRNTTIIDGRNGRNVTFIHCNNVTISGFTIQHDGETSDWYGIFVFGNDCTFEGNIIQKNAGGIALSNGVPNINPRNHRILNNIIQNNHYPGIASYIEGFNFTISGNIIANNGDEGINAQCSKSKIVHNVISGNHRYGIIIFGTQNNITENTIQNHVYKALRGTGIRIDGTNNHITRNNLLNNTRHAVQKIRGNLSEILTIKNYNNVWDGNYWGEPLTEPVRISGLFIGIVKGWPFDLFWLPCPTFDKHPAQEPYDIPGMT